MKQLSYKVDHKTYIGFKALNGPFEPIGDQRLVIVWFEGSPELWLVENKIGYANLRNMYKDLHGDLYTTYLMQSPPLSIVSFVTKNA